MSVTYKNTGLQAIRAGLPAAIDAGVKAGCEHVADLAQQLAPEDTGALKASKLVEPVRTGRWRVSFGRGLRDARAVHQEYGTSRMAAQPYLTPAVQAIDFDQAVGDAVAALITRNGL